MPEGNQQAITRRGLLSHGGRLVLGASAGSVLLAACGEDSGSGGGSGGGAKKGGTIRVGLQESLYDTYRPHIDAFTKQTGIKVRLSAVPPAGGDQVTQLTPQFSSSTTPVDALMTSDEATPSFIQAGWLEPLTAEWNKVKDDHPADMQAYVKQWSSKDGEVYRIPMGWSVGFYWVRQDVLDRLKADVPAKWDDLLDLKQKASSRGMFAFADAVSKPSLATVYMAYLCSQSGGQLFDFDDGTRQAFQYAKQLIDTKAFPKAALNWTYDQLNANYMNDKIATMRQWNYFFSVARDNKKWFEDDKAVIVLPPAGPAGRGTWAGAWGWTIPKFSKSVDQAKQFIAFMTTSELAPQLAKANSQLVMPRSSINEAMPDDGTVKAMAEYSKAGVTKTRPWNANVGQAQSVVDTIASSYLSGQMSLDEAMTKGKQRIDAI